MRQMRCSRCGYDFAALDRNARACPNCGLPLSLPIPTLDAAPRTTTPPVVGGAPAGWEPAPAPTPTHSPFPAADRTSPPAPMPDAGTVATQRLPTVSAGAPAAGPNTAMDGSPTITLPTLGGDADGRRSQRRSLSIIAAVVVVAVILGVVGLLAANGGSKKTTGAGRAKATATARATPTLPANYTLYTDANGVYAIAYPSDWSTTPVDGTEFTIALFADTGLGATVEVERVSHADGALSATAAQTFLSDAFTGFSQALAGGATVSNQSSVSRVTLADSEWFEESADASYTVAGSQMTSRIVVDVTNHGGSTLMLARVAAQTGDYDSLNAKYFTPMIATFRFLA